MERTQTRSRFKILHPESRCCFTVLRRLYWKPFLCSVASAGVVLALAGHSTRGWQGMLLKAAIFAILYFTSVALSRFFDQFDLAKAESVIPAMRFARRIIPVA